MRALICLIFGTGMILAASPASAQRYDPAFPVCMELTDDNGTREECTFQTMEQCRESARSMPGSCFPNPYYKPSAAPAADVAPEPVPTPSPTPSKKKKKG